MAGGGAHRNTGIGGYASRGALVQAVASHHSRVHHVVGMVESTASACHGGSGNGRSVRAAGGPSTAFGGLAVLIIMGAVCGISIMLCIRNSRTWIKGGTGAVALAILEALSLPITIITLAGAYIIGLYVFRTRRH